MGALFRPKRSLPIIHVKRKERTEAMRGGGGAGCLRIVLAPAPRTRAREPRTGVPRLLHHSGSRPAGTASRLVQPGPLGPRSGRRRLPEVLVAGHPTRGTPAIVSTVVGREDRILLAGLRERSVELIARNFPLAVVAGVTPGWQSRRKERREALCRSHTRAIARKARLELRAA